jgi:hypothetical protein
MASYARLKLKKGGNCIYLRRFSHANWGGVVTQSEGACGTDVAGFRFNQRVQVEWSGTGGSIDPVPAVARWHQGTDGREPALGVKCGGMWCIVVPPDHFAVNRPGNPTNAHGLRVRGRFDHQNVGVVRSPRTGSPARYEANFTATVFPVENLAQLDASSFRVAGWVHVATVRFPQATAGTHYDAKFGFRQGDNLIGLRIDPASGNWQAAVIDANGNQMKPLAVERPRHDHPAPVPGVARFAWREDDEDLWIRCDQGCCRISPAGDQL